MLEFFDHCFAFLCGQNPDHTWAPGGLLLPCCQRCLGLYVGAGIAACLHWRLRPTLTSRFLETHGIFLLLMAPFGFHWVPQNGLMRAISGTLFGFGVVTFLWLPLEAWARRVFAQVRLGASERARRERHSCRQASNPGEEPAQRIVHTPRSGSPEISLLSGVHDSEPDRAPGAPTQAAATSVTGYGIGLAATVVLTPLFAAVGGTAAAYGLAALALFGAAAIALLILANASFALVKVFHVRNRAGATRLP